MSCFSFFLNCSRGGGAPLFIYFDFFLLLKRRGRRLRFFFSPALDMCKEEGGEGGLVFSRKLFLEFLSGYITKWGPLCISAI